MYFCYSTNKEGTDVSSVKTAAAVGRDASLFPSFSCKSREKREPTSGLEPLTCSSYE
jgi:hypothetical protein